MNILGIIVIAAICTFATRITPFLLFGTKKGVPDAVSYLGKVLPAAIMGVLIIYCLKNVSFTVSPFGIPEITATIVVILLHQWKRNTLLSIAGGTILYMLMVQNFFNSLFSVFIGSITNFVG